MTEPQPLDLLLFVNALTSVVDAEKVPTSTNSPASIMQQLKKGVRMRDVCAQGVKSIYTYEIRSCDGPGGTDERTHKRGRM